MSQVFPASSALHLWQPLYPQSLHVEFVLGPSPCTKWQNPNACDCSMHLKKETNWRNTTCECQMKILSESNPNCSTPPWFYHMLSPKPTWEIVGIWCQGSTVLSFPLQLSSSSSVSSLEKCAEELREIMQLQRPGMGRVNPPTIFAGISRRKMVLSCG